MVNQDTDQQFKYIACKWTNNVDISDEDDEDEPSFVQYSYIQLKTIYHPILRLPLEEIVPSHSNTHNKFCLLDCCYYVNKLYNYDQEIHSTQFQQ